jgi:hypothetical protein
MSERDESPEIPQLEDGNVPLEDHDEEEKQDWVNIGTRYILPRSFLENCIVLIERFADTVYIRTVEPHKDLTLNFTGEKEAVKQFTLLHELLNEQKITCNIDFGSLID